MNLRGNDIPFNPVFKSYLLLDFNVGSRKKGCLYICNKKIDNEIASYLSDYNIEQKPYEAIYEDLAKIEDEIIVNRSAINYSLFKQIPPQLISEGKYPLKKLKVSLIK